MWTNDPLADFARHEAQQQKKLDKLPHCSECGEPIQDEYLYEFCGDLMCQECLESQYKKPVEDFID